MSLYKQRLAILFANFPHIRALKRKLSRGFALAEPLIYRGSRHSPRAQREVKEHDDF